MNVRSCGPSNARGVLQNHVELAADRLQSVVRVECCVEVHCNRDWGITLYGIPRYPQELFLHFPMAQYVNSVRLRTLLRICQTAWYHNP
jgi:hypothetical protein